MKKPVLLWSVCWLCLSMISGGCRNKQKNACSTCTLPAAVPAVVPTTTMYSQPVYQDGGATVAPYEGVPVYNGAAPVFQGSGSR